MDLVAKEAQTIGASAGSACLGMSRHVAKGFVGAEATEMKQSVSRPQRISTVQLGLL